MTLRSPKLRKAILFSSLAMLLAFAVYRFCWVPAPIMNPIAAYALPQSPQELIEVLKRQEQRIDTVRVEFHIDTTGGYPEGTVEEQDLSWLQTTGKQIVDFTRRYFKSELILSMDPGQSMKVHESPRNSACATEISTLMWRERASSDASPTVFPSLIEPFRGIAPLT